MICMTQSEALRYLYSVMASATQGSHQIMVYVRNSAQNARAICITDCACVLGRAAHVCIAQTDGQIVAEVDNSIKTISLKLSRSPHSFILNRQITNQVINVQINQT